MTEQEAIEIARKVAEAEGWYWTEPCETKLYRHWWLLGRLKWCVRSNADYWGANVVVTIDDATGKVLRKGFAPR
ncbi:MAG: hypothetical protein L0154_21915 [Chloroflexi bacterium]|nr:hypothetical protein [Chloroflexota bacterium]